MITFDLPFFDLIHCFNFLNRLGVIPTIFLIKFPPFFTDLRSMVISIFIHHNLVIFVCAAVIASFEIPPFCVFRPSILPIVFVII
ncbi:hypothetical protein SAMN04487897_10424 [Paenibacillus sp. yr247]|nr:hypothetical protein SAMN04487897_10424 [Paenibacillus sp. yr247]